MTTRRALLACLLVALVAACKQVGFHEPSPVVQAFDADPRVALPAIEALADSERPDATAVLQHIRADPDPARREAAERALRRRASRLYGNRAETAGPVARARAEIRRLNDHMVDRLRVGDLAGVAAVYADDAVLLSADGERHEGRQAVDAYWTGLQNPLDWKLDVLDVEGRDGLFVQRGRSHLTTARDGLPRTSVVDFMLVWRRERPDGPLRIVLDAWW